jgi:hypothetical protein
VEAALFDQLTLGFAAGRSRRTFVVAVAAGLAGLSGLVALDLEHRAEAKGGKKRKGRGKGKGKRLRCKKLGGGCTPETKRKCCGELICSTIAGQGPARCCKQPSEPCTNFDDCCSGFCFEGTCLST